MPKTAIPPLTGQTRAAYRRVTRDERSATEQELAIAGITRETVLGLGAGRGGSPCRLPDRRPRRPDPSEACSPSSGSGWPQRAHELLLSRKRWEDATIGRDVEPHDIVVAAFSLGFYDLAAALEKLDAAARRAVYIFWHAGEWRNPGEMALYRTVFGDEAAGEKGYPDYIFPVNILHAAGIYPNVRIDRAAWDAVYDSVEDAARTWAAMHNPGMEDLAPVREYFARALRKDGSGKYIETAVRPTAAVWWEKEGR